MEPSLGSLDHVSLVFPRKRRKESPMSALLIAGLLCVILYGVFKNRDIKSDKGSFAGEILWIAILSVLLGAYVAINPHVLPGLTWANEKYGKAEYEGISVGTGKVVGTGTSVSVSASAGGSSAQAQATVVSLTPSKEGIKLMDQYYGKIVREGRKLKSFENLGGAWYWCVVDPSVSPTAGQDVVGGVYEVTDPSVTSVTVFCARKVNGVYEFGDRRTFPLR
ncbi:MAG: hypothetical protein UY90_C0023G0004 [Candidatus Peregrinibacteria bacterium GW2011_GWA2_54_9]|nr:MAG: hypothetical protein UY90_C0023G0004 [Candidatus Peregrinibacteria bacterium GW2011_GWA2_54_9]